ncbi:MAG: hypothetical protein JO244_14665 [Solirubrobacterales bacterium]|nr:hypothetical protein [Solirubrobacterales bacterium]
MNFRASSRLVWFAVGGGPVAWAIQFVIGLGFGYGECDQAGRALPVHAGQVAATALATLVALASLGAGVWLFRNTYRTGNVFAEELRGDGASPPVGRINFLAIVGITVNLLILALIILQGIGPALMPQCQQA